MNVPAPAQRERVRSIVASLLMLIIIAAFGFVFFYRAYYNILPGQEATARVHWCERDYQNDGPPTETWHQVTAENRVPVRAFGTYPPLGFSPQELFAAILFGAQPGSCTTVIYLRIGPDKYQSYSLLGGP
jgi:hypothetical protein